MHIASRLAHTINSFSVIKWRGSPHWPKHFIIFYCRLNLSNFIHKMTPLYMIKNSPGVNWNTCNLKHFTLGSTSSPVPSFIFFDIYHTSMCLTSAFFTPCLLTYIYIWCPFPQGTPLKGVAVASLHVSLSLHACLAYTISCILPPFLSLKYSSTLFPYIKGGLSLPLTPLPVLSYIFRVNSVLNSFHTPNPYQSITFYPLLPLHNLFFCIPCNTKSLIHYLITLSFYLDVRLEYKHITREYDHNAN